MSYNIKKATFFAVQIDSTHDVNVHDHMICEWYNSVECKSGTGNNVSDVVCIVFKDLNLINVKNFIDSSTDGAI